MDKPIDYNFNAALKIHNVPALTRAKLSQLQVNIGYLCNQACEHCHVEAGPKRTEMMSWETMQKVANWAIDNDIKSVDITGGAPELIAHFRAFCDLLLAHDIHIISRCNLTVLFEPGQEDLATWYAKRGITLVCSLPCYSRENVDKQRGKGVFGKSIDALIALNEQGYGRDDDKILNLVYNPIGASLPPEQEKLEIEYKKRLQEDFGIVFNQLFALTNLPVKRFEHFLKRSGQWQSYMQLLHDNFNTGTIEALMCRHLISVDWQGFVYDCDFNQMLDLPHASSVTPEKRQQLWHLNTAAIADAPIAVGHHCFGCTAGAGSSCGGSLT